MSYELLLEKKNVVGAGIGFKITNGENTGRMSVVTMVSRKVPKETLMMEDIIPTGYAGMPTDVIETGEFKALSTTDKFRPAPGGVSIGHHKITAGTLGVVLKLCCYDRVILSNNHVLANSNDAEIGDIILQPGPYDGGKVGTDDIAVLEDFVPIKFNQSSICPFANTVVSIGNKIAKMLNSSKRLKLETEYNLVDAAIALPLKDSDVLDEILEIGVIEGTQEPYLNMAIRKYGRTTDYTEDKILILHSTVNVSYGAGKVARFEDQVVAGAMSNGGDSGSLIVDRSSQNAVGLLFAGSDTHTIFNPINYILEALSLSF